MLGLGLHLTQTAVRGGPATRVVGPQILISNRNQDENTAIGTTIGTFTVVGGTGTYTFTKTADPDSAFTLTGAALKNAIVFDYETATSHNVTIHADNGAGSTADRTLGIAVNDIDEVPPVITSSPTQTIPENSAFSLTLTADKTATWTKTGGADAALFTLTAGVLSLPAQDFEAPADANTDNAYIVQVTATSATGFASNQTITLIVTDVATVLPGTPTLVWTSDVTVSPPVFSVSVPTDADMVVGDIAKFTRSTTPDGSSGVSTFSHTITSPEDAANAFTISSGVWANGPWYVGVQILRGEGATAFSNIETKTLAVVAAGPPATALYGWWAADHSYTETSGTPTTLITADGTAIGSQADRSGNGNHAYQTTAGNKPIYKTGILNSLPSGRYNDGSQTYLQVATGPTGNSFSMYAVFNRSSGVSPVAAIVTQNDSGINPRYALFDNGSGTTEIWNGGAGAAVATSITDYHLVAGNVDNTGAFPTQIQLDNTSIVSANAAGGGVVGTALTIGGLQSFGRYWNGDILEVLIYTSVHTFSSSDGLLVRQYLNTKYNLGLGI